MAGMRAVAEWLGLRARSYDQDMGYEDPRDDGLASVTRIDEPPRARTRDYSPGPAPARPMDVAKIRSVKPTAYRDAVAIGDAYRQGVPVVINLTDMPESEAKRLVDFAAGLSYGLRGDLKKVTTSVFLLSPAHVEVAADAEPGLMERDLLAQG